MKPVVAIVGRPNTGKSTLFNKLVGQRLSIVDDTPGVTRDRIFGDCEWLNRHFLLVDTGGIEPKTDDVILLQMRRQAQLAIDSAAVIILVTDVRAGVVASDADVAAMLQKSGKPIITISDFCKEQISEVYHVPKKRIAVIPCGWQHFLTTGEDDSLFGEYPRIEKGKYFFALGSLEERKNFKWIVEEAKRDPDSTFVIAGGSVKNSSEKLSLDGMDNLIFVGYISDEQIKSLMRHCKAFLFPSTFEGFGIPPLEAMSVGAKVISSDSASMPEVLGDSAVYIDPYSHERSLEELLRTPTAPASEALERYSWERSAGRLLRLIKKYGRQ